MDNWRREYPEFSAHYDWLSGYLHEKRLLHSVGVFVRTQEFCTRFGLSEAETNQALTAALLHDCAKLFAKDTLLDKARALGVILSNDDMAAPATWHAHVGAAMVQDELDIDDEVILNAVRRHTTADSNMSTVDMIVYVADKIEPYTRDLDFIETVMSHMTGNTRHALHSGFRYCIDDSLRYLSEAGKTIHPKTQAAHVFISNLLQEKGDHTA